MPLVSGVCRAASAPPLLHGGSRLNASKPEAVPKTRCPLLLGDVVKTRTVKMVSKAINLAMRGLQFFWTLLIIALVGNMIATAFAGNPSIVNYDMFVAVFGMLSLLYLIPATFNESLAFHPALMVGLDVLNTLFFFVGGVATAAELGVHSCGNAGYTASNKVTNGSHDMSKRCHEAQASTAFLWFGFAAFAASAVLSGLQSRGSGTSFRRGGPAMSQVSGSRV